MENLRPEGTEYQYGTSPYGETLGSNFHVRQSKRIINCPQWYNSGFGAAREWKNDDVASIFYMIQDRDLNIDVDTDDIISLMSDWDSEDCMYTPSTFHMR